MCQWRVALIITFGWIVHIDNVVWCRETSLGTSFQQNHPNHVLSTMGIRKGPMETMEPSLATPQTGKLALLCCHSVLGSNMTLNISNTNKMSISFSQIA